MCFVDSSVPSLHNVTQKVGMVPASAILELTVNVGHVSPCERISGRHQLLGELILQSLRFVSTCFMNLDQTYFREQF